MRYIFLLILFTTAILADVEYGGFELDGYERDYIVYLPAEFVPGLPLVFSLTGYGMTAQDEFDFFYMNDVADTAGFVVVYPNPVSPGWNSGIGTHPTYPVPEVDDVSFISALIDTIHTHYDVDLDRVYSCGFSNGGFMSFRLGAELGHRFKKVASVSGVVTQATAAAAVNALAIPVLCILGTSDPVVPYSEEEGGWYSGIGTIDFWVQHNGCSAQLDSIILPDMDPYDNCSVVLFPYTGVLEGTQVMFYRILGGGHKWPSGFDWDFNGNINNDIHGSEVIWQFFNSKPFGMSGVWVQNLWVDSPFAQPGVEDITVLATIANPQNHSYSVYAYLYDEEMTFIDSFQLHDDGQHSDFEANDGIAGLSIVAPNDDGYFYLQTSTNDETVSSYLGPHDLTQFTTIGPMVFHSVEQVYPDNGVIQPNNTVYFNLSLDNHGLESVAENINVKISPADTNSSMVSGYNYTSFSDIPAGGSMMSLTMLALKVGENVPDETPIHFDVEILYEGNVFWEGIGALLGTVGIDYDQTKPPTYYNLQQNYPNPFNPTTIISYALPEQSNVQLRVFDIRGQEITTLEQSDKPPGNYEVMWNGMNQQGNPVSTGVYFCRLEAGTFTQTIKMVYLR
ncbi:MAG: T9SS type A sorting domain-containing protein [Candidatus Marinimicrobia bacterium]|nr:T9SS type A sorting domain-containing protein [Candidatus Neomarinimicrobiota bacterium]